LKAVGRGAELVGSFDAVSGAKSTKKTERMVWLELFGLVGDVGGANETTDTTAARFQSQRA
jgi:hypothetical protein